MTRSRMEAFSDGVLAIVITIMVLELRPPHGDEFGALKPLIPVFLSYVLSFVYLGIYWNNHHHLLQASPRVSGGALWANLHLLFWLSLVPFVTAWMGDNHFSSRTVALYGFVLLMASIAYYLLTLRLVAANGTDSPVARALGADYKGKLSTAIYVAAIALAMWLPLGACALYVAVAAMWLIPDRRMERALHE